MSFKASVLGQVNQRLWANPAVGATVTTGLAVGTAAGVSSYVGTEGTSSAKFDAGASSAIKWGTIGTGVIGAGLIGANVTGSFRAGWEGYKGPGASAYGTARNVRDLTQIGSTKAGQYAQSYSQELISELRSSGGWKKTLTRPTVSGGLGAMIGAGVGHHLSGDTQGTVAGAAIGAGVGVAVGRAVKAGSVWSKWGTASKVGAIAAGSIALGAGLSVIRGPQYDNVDVARSEDSGYDSGVADRMKSMNVDGNLVFGLHHRNKQKVGIR